MASKKEALADLGLLLLRMGAGVQLALLHGWDKLRHFSERAPTWPDPFSLGHKNALIVTVVGEFACGLLMALGLATRFAALVAAAVLGIGLFAGPAKPAWSGREATILYLCTALAVLLLGAGRLSLDKILVPRIFRRAGKGAGKASKPPGE